MAPKLVVAWVDVLENHVVDWLKGHRIEIVDVPYRDCIGPGCNVVSAPDVSQFQHGGVHCMSQSLRRDRATRPPGDRPPLMTRDRILAIVNGAPGRRCRR